MLGFSWMLEPIWQPLQHSLTANRCVPGFFSSFKPSPDIVDLFEKLPETNIALQVTVNDAALVDKPKIAPEGSNTLERLTKDLDQARRLIILLQAETDGTSRTAVEQDGLKAIDNRMQAYAPADATTDDNAQLKKTKLHLDLYLTYLRKVFHTCYYSGSINDSREELEARCIKYLRKVPSIVTAPPASGEAVVPASESAPAEGSESVDPRNGASGEAALDDEDAEVHRREDGESATAAVKTAEQIKADSAVTVKLADRTFCFGITTLPTNSTD